MNNIQKQNTTSTGIIQPSGEYGKLLPAPILAGAKRKLFGYGAMQYQSHCGPEVNRVLLWGCMASSVGRHGVCTLPQDGVANDGLKVRAIQLLARYPKNKVLCVEFFFCPA